MRFSGKRVPPVLSVRLSPSLRAPSRKGRRFISCQQLKLLQQALPPLPLNRQRQRNRLKSLAAAKSFFFECPGGFSVFCSPGFTCAPGGGFSTRRCSSPSVKTASQGGRSLAPGY